MKEKKSHLTGLLICLTVAGALLLGVYLYGSMTNPALALPSWTLYAIAGALGLTLIMTIIQGVSAKKAKKKAKPEQEAEDAEQEGEEKIAEEEAQEVETDEKEEEVEAEPQAEEEAEVEEANDEDEPQEEIKEEEPQEETQPEEEPQEEAQPEEAPQDEEPQEETQEEQEPEEEKEEMVAEENEELKAAPIAAEVEEQPEEVEEQPEEAQEEPVQEEVKEEPKAAEPEKEVVTPSIAAFISDQQKLNENIEKRLEGIDNSLKIIADALKSLLYDAVPAGVTTVAVSTQEVPQPQPQAQPEDDVADGGNYFEQVEEEQKIEDQNAEIADNYAEGWIATADQDSRIKPKMSFEMRLRVAAEDIKRFYSDIKNELLSYGIHDRISRHRENFNQGRINICRMVINGKTLKVYLAVDPESIDKRYFHHTDVGHRKGLVELPTMINVRSKVAARKVKELITLMMESLVISKKPYEEHDFAKDLTVEGFTTVECKGYDYLVEKSTTLDKVKEYPDSFAAQLLEMVEDNEYQERFIKTYLTVDDIVKNFKDGDVVDIDKVRELGLGPANSNFLSIKESNKLAKKFKIYANEYTPNAVKMICLAGGEAFLVIQPEKTIEEV